MKSIKVNILGKQYPLKVDEAEEENMLRIANYVDDTFREYKQELSKQQETTVMTMAALSIAEELFEERQRNNELGRKDDAVMEEVNASLEKFVEKIKA